jgi:hypothetical protein
VYCKISTQNTFLFVLDVMKYVKKLSRKYKMTASTKQHTKFRNILSMFAKCETRIQQNFTLRTCIQRMPNLVRPHEYWKQLAETEVTWPVFVRLSQKCAYTMFGYSYTCVRSLNIIGKEMKIFFIFEKY